MSKQTWKFIRNISIVFVAVGLFVLILPRLVTTMYSSSRIYTVASAPAERIAIVFGAGLTRDGQPTLILRDRVKTAVQLYLSGKVEKLLMSGDNQGINHDEPGAMRDYAVSLGVPADDVVLDNSGDRTYDTCYRAKAIFGLDSALLVTQAISFAARIVLVQHARHPSRWRGREQLLLLAATDVDLEHPRTTCHGRRVLGCICGKASCLRLANLNLFLRRIK